MADLHLALMNGPHHRDNLLNPNLTYIGIGIEMGDFTFSSGQTYQSVITTQNFAATQGTADLDVLPAPAVTMTGDDIGDMGADTLIGNSGWNALNGGADNDLLYGGSGNDTLAGGAGDDFLRGGTLADTFIYNSGGGADIIDDFLISDGDTLILDSAFWGDAETTADLLASYGSIGGDGLYALNFGGGDRNTFTVQIDAPDLADHLFRG